MVFLEQPDFEEEVIKLLISIIILYGKQGLPLERVEAEFANYCGYQLPYRKFGFNSLRAWVQTLPDIYLIKEQGREFLIQQSRKSYHLKRLIENQKPSYYNDTDTTLNSTATTSTAHSRKPRNYGKKNNNKYFMHDSINDVKFSDLGRYEVFKKLENMLPLFYNHQALGDDFFLDIADTKFGYYVPEKGPKECGLCVAGQTIAELTKQVKNAESIAPRCVVMIGLNDLLKGSTVSKMIFDLKQLVKELKKRNTRVTLVTLVKAPKMPKWKHLQERMDIFNRAILDYTYESEDKCNVIDMGSIFLEEQMRFQRDIDRFSKITKKDDYKVFSDYGRKVFLSNLRNSLKQQIECGH